MDYSHYYRIYHNDSAEHEALMIDYHKKQLSPYLPEQRIGKVLDIGCGMGFAIKALYGMGFNDVSGIEVDRSQAEYCQSKNLNVELVDDSLEYLRGHVHEYVLITILDVLEHVPAERQIDFLTAVHNSLAPGGRTIIQVPNANSPVAVRWFYNDFTHYRSYTENSIRYVLANAGFSRISVPGSGPLGRPPIKLWTRAARSGLRRWFVQLWWRQVLKATLPGINPSAIPLDVNLLAVADR